MTVAEPHGDNGEVPPSPSLYRGSWDIRRILRGLPSAHATVASNSPRTILRRARAASCSKGECLRGPRLTINSSEGREGFMSVIAALAAAIQNGFTFFAALGTAFGDRLLDRHRASRTFFEREFTRHFELLWRVKRLATSIRASRSRALHPSRRSPTLIAAGSFPRQCCRRNVAKEMLRRAAA